MVLVSGTAAAGGALAFGSVDCGDALALAPGLRSALLAASVAGAQRFERPLRGTLALASVVLEEPLAFALPALDSHVHSQVVVAHMCSKGWLTG